MLELVISGHSACGPILRKHKRNHGDLMNESGTVIETRGHTVTLGPLSSDDFKKSSRQSETFRAVKPNASGNDRDMSSA